MTLGRSGLGEAIIGRLRVFTPLFSFKTYDHSGIHRPKSVMCWPWVGPCTSNERHEICFRATYPVTLNCAVDKATFVSTRK